MAGEIAGVEAIALDIPLTKDFGGSTYHVLKRSTERYFMEIFDKRSCVELMDANPLVFEMATPLRAMSDALANLDERLLIDGFIVTRDGAYFGSGRSSDLRYTASSDREGAGS